MTTDGNTSDERRRHHRYAASISVDYGSDDNFLFAYIENISKMGIFIRTDEPMPVGTELTLRFDSSAPSLELEGIVVWVNPIRLGSDNPNPGMGVHFRGLTLDQRERVVDFVRTVAYLREAAKN